MACKCFKLAKYKFLEIQLENFKDGLSINMGMYATLATWGFNAKVGLGLFQIELRLQWRGDHNGAEFYLETFDGNMLNIHFYDSRHDGE
jgi:hypothetical protein